MKKDLLINSTTDFNINEVMKNSYASLEYYVMNDYKIYLDTCALLSPGAGWFWMVITPLLQKYNKKIFILQQVVEELHKLMETKADDIKLMGRIIRAIEFIKSFESGIEIVHDIDSVTLTDQALLIEMMKVRTSSNMLIITNDRNLMLDLLNTRNSRAVMGKLVTVKRINPYGFLSNISEEQVQTECTCQEAYTKTGQHLLVEAEDEYEESESQDVEDDEMDEDYFIDNFKKELEEVLHKNIHRAVKVILAAK